MLVINRPAWSIGLIRCPVCLLLSRILLSLRFFCCSNRSHRIIILIYCDLWYCPIIFIHTRFLHFLKIVSFFANFLQDGSRCINISYSGIFGIFYVKVIDFLYSSFCLYKLAVTSSLILMSFCMERISPSRISFRVARKRSKTLLACMSKRGIIFNRRGSHFTSHSSCIITLFLTKS